MTCLPVVVNEITEAAYRWDKAASESVRFGRYKTIKLNVFIKVNFSTNSNNCIRIYRDMVAAAIYQGEIKTLFSNGFNSSESIGVNTVNQY